MIATNPRGVLRVSVAVVIALLVSGCAGRYQGHLFAVPGPDAQRLPKSKGVISFRKGIAVATAAQNEVKEADTFYIIIFNQTRQYISFDTSQIRLLDQNGKSRKPMSRAEKNFIVGARVDPKPPIGLSRDVFRQTRSFRQNYGDRVSPLNAGDMFKMKIMPGRTATFFVFFRKRHDSPTMTLVLPNIELGGTKEKVTFLFRYEVQRE